MTGLIKANGLSPGVAGGTGRPVATAAIPYSYSGLLVVGSSPGVTPHLDTQIVGFSATLINPGSTETTVALLVNGAQVAEVVLAADDTYGYQLIGGVNVQARTDTYSVAVTEAAADASDLGGEIEIVGTSP